MSTWPSSRKPGSATIASLGRELDLFSIQDEAGPGLIFWHPKGGIIRKEIEDWLREELLARGYDLVFTPQCHAVAPVGDERAHRTSISENMFGPMAWRTTATSSSP